MGVYGRKKNAKGVHHELFFRFRFSLVVKSKIELEKK